MKYWHRKKHLDVTSEWLGCHLSAIVTRVRIPKNLNRTFELFVYNLGGPQFRNESLLTSNTHA